MSVHFYRRYENHWNRFLAAPSHYPVFQARAAALGITLTKLHRRLIRQELIAAHKAAVRGLLEES